jgi:hypothetical protein
MDISLGGFAFAFVRHHRGMASRTFILILCTIRNPTCKFIPNWNAAQAQSLTFSQKVHSLSIAQAKGNPLAVSLVMSGMESGLY